MAITYKAIANVTLGSNNTITFSSIPQTYTDLRMIVTALPASTQTYVQFRLNNNTNNVYGQQVMSGFGAGNKNSYLNAADTVFWCTYGISVPFQTSEYITCTVDIFNYTNTGMFKPVLISTGRSGNSGGNVGVEKSVGQFASVAAIDSINIRGNSGNLYTGSRVTLYGILRA